jgi:hypothetical protein
LTTHVGAGIGALINALLGNAAELILHLGLCARGFTMSSKPRSPARLSATSYSYSGSPCLPAG